MKRKFRQLVLALACALLSGQAAAASDDLVAEFLEATGAQTQYREMTKIMNRSMKAGFMQGFKESIADREIPAGKRQAINELMAAEIDGFLSDVNGFVDRTMPWSALVSEVYGPTLRRHFSDDELRQIIAFHRTEVGRKMVDQMPTIMQEASLTVQQNYAPSINRFAVNAMQTRLAGLKDKVDGICAGEC